MAIALKVQLDRGERNEKSEIQLTIYESSVPAQRSRLADAVRILHISWSIEPYMALNKCRTVIMADLLIHLFPHAGIFVISGHLATLFTLSLKNGVKYRRTREYPDTTATAAIYLPCCNIRRESQSESFSYDKYHANRITTHL